MVAKHEARLTVDRLDEDASVLDDNVQIGWCVVLTSHLRGASQVLKDCWLMDLEHWSLSRSL